MIGRVIGGATWGATWGATGQATGRGTAWPAAGALLLGATLLLSAMLHLSAGHAAAQDGPLAWDPVEEASHLLVTTGKAGLFGFLGHDHAIRATEWDGVVCVDPARPRAGRAKLTVVAGALEIDSDTARALAGMGDGPGEEDRREIRERMLGPDNLAAAEHPRILLEIRGLDATGGDDRGPPMPGPPPPETTGAAAREGPVEMRVRSAVTVRGVATEADTGIELHIRGDTLVAEGELEMRLTDFGIEPESIAGVVKVADEIDLIFRIVAASSGTACAAGDAGG